MRPCSTTKDEVARLEALAEYELVETSADASFRHIVELASQIFDVPTAFISLIDKDHQNIHAKIGFVLSQIDRKLSFCDYAIRQHTPLIVLDALRDPRFHDSPMVTGPARVCFYAGVPLRSRAGHAVGTLCLTDTKPRQNFAEADQRTLQALAGLVFDRMEVCRLHASRQESQSRFEQIAGTSPDGIICANKQGRITFWNAAAERLFGHTSQAALGQSIDLIVPEQVRGNHEGSLHKVAAGGRPRLVGQTVELLACHKDGTEFPIELSLSMWQEDGEVAFGSIVRDIRRRRADEERLFHLAHRDPLTELFNRTVLRNRLTDIIAAGRPVSVLALDLDDFKEINDGFGHAAGDAVLTTVAARLLTCVRATDTVSRVGGDEFAILLPDVGDPLGAATVADAVIAAITKSFLHDGQTLRLGTSVGIAIGPSHGESADELLSCADLALYQAKGDGRHCHRLFTPSLRQQAQRIHACRDELGRAIERDELVLFYQPQVRLSDGAVVGAEALIRWQHPRHGLLAPAAFLDALDGSRYAGQVGDWVLSHACRQAAEWRRLGAPDFRIGVNLCGAQFQRGDLAKTVDDALRIAGLPAANLELEITETIVLRYDAKVIASLHSLREAGVGVAFDDYGTGYASLSLLKRFPLTRLKIDRSFVTGMLASHQDITLVKAILQLGHGFDLTVIAEGIETAEEHALLRAEGCQEGQGYLFGKPMSAAAFADRYGLDGPRAADVAAA